MYDRAIVLSECIKIKREMAIFHFKGFFNGVKIMSLQMHLAPHWSQLKEKEIYLMLIRINGIEESRLICDILKCYTLDEIQQQDSLNLGYEHLLNHQP